MKLKLKEDPREWLKFTAVMLGMLALVAFLLHRRKLVNRDVMWMAEFVLVGVLAVCAIRPRWFRGFYRAGMTASFHIGQVMGRVLLTVFFLVILTPLGLLLRLSGKDLLGLKRNPSATTYWHPARPNNNFDRQF